jgi:hypothetical protein
MQSYRDAVARINEAVSNNLNRLALQQGGDPRTIAQMREGLLLYAVPRPMRVPR